MPHQTGHVITHASQRTPWFEEIERGASLLVNRPARRQQRCGKNWRPELDAYTTEQEQIEKIKKWWAENGKAIVLGLILGLGGLFGYRYWESARIAAGESASINYEHLLAIASAGASDEANEAGEAIINGYPDSTYAKLSALVLAKLAVDAGKLEDAKARLQWVMDNSAGSALQPIAQTRLAQIHLADGNVDAAAALLDKVDTKYADQFAELRGDILLAQGKVDEARAMFSQALAAAHERGSGAETLELKIDNLALANQ